MTQTEERRLLSVLFADLAGFTILAQQLDPEEVREAVSLCFERLNPIIARHGGIIHDYGGDLVIALFGVPETHEDDPERAVRAAFEMLECLPGINAVLKSRFEIKAVLGLHVGISSGTVFVGEIGSLEKTEHTVMGEVVNLASRLKDTAKNGEILVSEPVYRLTRYLFDYEGLTSITLKGIEGEIRVFKPIKEKDVMEPKRGIKGLYSPLVGRDEVLRLIKERVDRLNQQKGGAVFITGEPGLGKSRLVEELKKSYLGHQDSANRISFLEGRCLSYGGAQSYHPFLQILRNIVGISERDSVQEVKQRVLTSVSELMPDESKEIAPYIGYLFSVRFSDEYDEKIKHLDPKGLKIQLLLSIRKLLRAVARKGNLVLVIEDYHWIDGQSLELLEFIFDVPEALPFLLIVLSRIEKEKEFYKTKERIKKKLANNFLEIGLKPLAVDAVRQITENLLRVSALPDRIRDRIVEKVEGNPLYLEEIIRQMIDEGTLVFDDNIWRMKTETAAADRVDVLAVSIPDTVQLIITSRMDRLDPDVRDVLQLASVIGRSFNVQVLERLSNLDSFMASLCLAILEESEFIARDVSSAELRYQFRHAIVHEVAYNGILKKKRKELHRRVAKAIERIYFERVDEFTDLLAYQYANSDDREKALEWLEKASRKAKERYASDEAITYFEDIIRIVKKDLKDRRYMLGPVYEALGDIYNLRGEYEKALKSLEMMYQNVDAVALKAEAKRKIAEVYHNHSQYDNALRAVADAEEMLDDSSEESMIEKAEIHIMRCSILRSKGEMNQALTEGEEGLSIVEALSPKRKEANPVRARGYNSVGVIFNLKAEYSKAIEYFQKCLKISEEVGDKRMIGNAYSNIGIVCYYTHRWDNAVDFYQKSLVVSEEIGDKQGIGRASNNLGLLYRHLRQHEKAIELFQKYLSIARETGDRQGIGVASGNLGPVYFDMGLYEQALELVKIQLAISQETGNKRSIEIATYNIGLIYYTIREYENAQEYYERDLEIARELEDKRGLGITRQSLGRLHLDKDELSSAEEDLVRAEALLREVDAKEELSITKALLARLWLKKGASSEIAANLTAEGLKCAGEVGSKTGMAECYFAQGLTYASISDFDRSKECFLKSIELYNELRSMRSLVDVYFEYAKLCESAGEKEDARLFLDKALDIKKTLKIK